MAWTIYTFKLIGSDEVRMGVMADELAEKLPDLVSWRGHFQEVDYGGLAQAMIESAVTQTYGEAETVLHG